MQRISKLESKGLLETKSIQNRVSLKLSNSNPVVIKPAIYT